MCTKNQRGTERHITEDKPKRKKVNRSKKQMQNQVVQGSQTRELN